MITFRQFLEATVSQDGIFAVMDRVKEIYPDVDLWAFEDERSVHVANLEVANKNRGTGTKVMEMVKDYAKSVGKPVVLSPEAARGKKEALLRFYTRLGFVKNKGRKKDYALSSFYGPTMYWKPNTEGQQ